MVASEAAAPFLGGQEQGLGGLLGNLEDSGGLSRVCSENLKASFLVLPNWPILQGLGRDTGRGSDHRPASAPRGLGWCFSFSGCPSLVLCGPLLPIEQQQRGEVFCRNRGQKQALLNARLPATARSQGPGEVEGWAGHTQAKPTLSHPLQ